MSKLLNNLPIEDLTKDNDYLGIIDKGQIIKTFLESNTDEFKDIKMFSLYGEWGSGKSTLMKYLQKELKGNFNTFFFEAWQFEKDDNLSISFLEFLLEKSNTVEEEFASDLIKFGGKLLRGLGKSVQFNVPLYPGGPTVKVNPSEFVDEFAKSEDVTFYKALEKFKVDFRKWEDLKNDRKDKNYNIIFIDDLDRCDPENVLNLLSALKLFFTYGEKTVFFCGIDKKAVNEAVKTKYNEVVKANEYLEKIFDISFNMPGQNKLFKLIDHYFKGLKTKNNESLLSEELVSFFNSIEFTNPRKIKKVLNKFLILENIKKSLPEQHSYLNLFPRYIDKEGGTYFETILVVYFITALEFNPSALECIFNLKEKQMKYYVDIKKRADHNNLGRFTDTLNRYINYNLTNQPLNQFSNENHFQNLMFTFLPIEIDVPHPGIFKNITFDQIRINQNSIQFKFIKYLINNIWMFSNSNDFSTVTLTNIKDLIKEIT